MKRNNLKNLFFLLLVTLALFLLDDTKLKKHIGYEKVKEYIKSDINVFGIAKGFFGNELYNLYLIDSPVMDVVKEEVKYNGGYLVYQDSDYLYSTYIGSVLNIEKVKDSYNLTISKTNGIIKIYNLKSVVVDVYQKVEINTVLGIIDGCYYYEEY